MTGGPLADPGVRRAYVLTKLGVLGLAALATVPLARVFGARAWVALAVFAVLLAVITVVVLAVGGRSATAVAAGDDTMSPDEDVDPGPDDPVVLPVEDSLDLHPFQPGDIPAVVEDYLEAAHSRGFDEVRLIHGRGIGVQRERVRSVLAKHPLVVEYHDAPPRQGGWGATVATLKVCGD